MKRLVVPEGVRRTALRSLLASLVQPTRSLFALKRADREQTPVRPVDLEARLIRHANLVRELPESRAALGLNIARAMAAMNSEAAEVVDAAGRPRSTQLAERLCLFAPFWLRSPYTWNRAEGGTLLDHLFVLYPVPGFLYPPWSQEGDVPEIKWLYWFILIAQGGSLRRMAKPLGWRVGAGLEAKLRDVPADLAPAEACLLAEVMRLGGSDIDCRRIRSCDSFDIDPTCLPKEDIDELEEDIDEPEGDVDTVRLIPERRASRLDFLNLWYTTARWMIRHRDAISDEQCAPILEWAIHLHTEGERGRAGRFSWSGRSPCAVIERSLEYGRERASMSRSRRLLRWDARGWESRCPDETAADWTFVELTSTRELLEEGKALRHCVASYDAFCASGCVAIVSMQRNGQRVLTLEVEPTTGRLLQARGAGNRPASLQEERVFATWLNAVVRPKLTATRAA